MSAQIKERPILFSGAMVRALLDGSKTQTRRVVKMPPSWDCFVCADWGDGWWPYRSDDGESPTYDNNEIRLNCPYGQPGDRLWVRESWKAHTTFDHLRPRDIPESHIWYLADDGYKAESRTRASMHMPRWASRILLEVVSVRVERLQDISEEDADAEGVKEWARGACAAGNPLGLTNAGYFSKLWEQTYGPNSWDANPWVWVIEFKRVAL